MNNWIVYYHQTPSGKFYIGITSNEVEKRWKNGEGYIGCPAFYRAIKKYGWENINHEIIVSSLSKEEASNFEKLLISKLDTTNPKNGYNIKIGGIENFIYSEEEIYQYWIEGYSIKEICDIIGCCPATVNHRLEQKGISYKERAYRRNNNGKLRKLVLDKWKEGKLLQEIQNELDISYPVLSQIVKNELKIPSSEIRKRSGFSSSGIIIEVYNLQGILLETIFGLKEAAKKYKVSPQTVRRDCNINFIPKTRNFYFRRKE